MTNIIANKNLLFIDKKFINIITKGFIKISDKYPVSASIKDTEYNYNCVDIYLSSSIVSKAINLDFINYCYDETKYKIINSTITTVFSLLDLKNIDEFVKIINIIKIDNKINVQTLRRLSINEIRTSSATS